jgi:hypothetical protein
MHKLDVPTNNTETGSSCSDAFEIIEQRQFGAMKMEVLRGALSRPTGSRLPHASRAIQTLKFMHFVLAEKWCIPGTSDPSTIMNGLGRMGLTHEAIGKEALDNYIDGVGYFEPQVDTDERQLHINLWFNDMLTVTVRLRPLILPADTDRHNGNALDELGKIQGSLCLAGPFAANLRHLKDDQAKYLLNCVLSGQVVECTSLSTIFAAARAWREKLVNPEDESHARDGCHRTKNLLSGYFKTSWSFYLLQYVFALVGIETYRMGAKFVILPSEINQMDIYLAALGNDFIPKTDIYLHKVIDDPNHQPLILGKGPMYSSLLEFIRIENRVVDIKTRPDTGSIAIMCFPVHARALAHSIYCMDRMEHALGNG